MASPWFGEFMGTAVLVLLGEGVVAGAVLKGSKAENAGWMAITAGWAFAVMMGAFTAIACGSPDAHLNPALTFAFALKTGNFDKVVPYVSAQLLGGFAGACLVWLHYYPHWAKTPDTAAKLAVFATAPAIRRKPFNLLCEVIATFVLTLLAAAVGSKAVSSTGLAPGLPPFLVGCVVWGIGLSLGATTGYAINPARDLGPRIAHAVLPIAGKGSSDWDYAPIPVIGPLIGATLAGLLIKALNL